MPQGLDFFALARGDKFARRGWILACGIFGWASIFSWVWDFGVWGLGLELVPQGLDFSGVGGGVGFWLRIDFWLGLSIFAAHRFFWVGIWGSGILEFGD